MPEIKHTKRLQDLLNQSLRLCTKHRHEFIMPEHILYELLHEPSFATTLFFYGNIGDMEEQLMEFFKNTEHVPKDVDYTPETSTQMGQMVAKAVQQVAMSNGSLLDIPHFVTAMLSLEESVAAYCLKGQLGERESEFMSDLLMNYDMDDVSDDNAEVDGDEDRQGEPWRRLVTCLNDEVASHNPLIGREEEMERTIQILCRKEKNNPLHVGEPGVGKTSIVYGLAARIEQGDVPARLLGCRIYQMDMGTMLAGTQYRGDFEKRIKQVMEGVKAEGHAIIYIDEIHNMIGAGKASDGALDASNMLKPYLEQGDIRFIGSTTYDEYNRYFARSRGIVRRFQQVDIAEPSVDDAIQIIYGLRKGFERFHNVTYRKEALEYAVRASHKYISDRRLPDKAIDLIDEAGAYRQLHPKPRRRQYVEKALIEEVLARVCKIDAIAMREDDNTQLATLGQRILARVFGQDEAVRQVVEAVQMAKAGLLDDNKPLASLLFVGPTGVGKTEVARVLAQELGIELVRFDMSEYTEKHAVAKLIGSPAGYVGYEDGGLLTDAIRKTPNCVLLLDEIEKAHADIYNILLQVMDYARLTDNKGQKADFRNVVVILTSNAGAQYASQASIGFNGNTSRGAAMLAQVKKTFKPEFINRLSGTVVFHDMDMPMATRILDKKLAELQDKLQARQVRMVLTGEARARVLKEGFTREYGAREMDRVINARLKPLLMRFILFGEKAVGGSRPSAVSSEGPLFYISNIQKKDKQSIVSIDCHADH